MKNRLKRTLKLLYAFGVVRAHARVQAKVDALVFIKVQIPFIGRGYGTGIDTGLLACFNSWHRLENRQLVWKTFVPHIRSCYNRRN